jgi:hypothetical protein
VSLDPVFLPSIANTDILSSIRFLHDAGMIVFLNKQDKLKEKVESGKSIATYFPEYNRYEMNSKGECN